MLAAARSVILASSCVVLPLWPQMHLQRRMLLFTWVMRVYLMLTDMAFGWMLARVDWGAHNVAVICANRGWREAAHLRFPLGWSPHSSQSAPLVFMDWFYWLQIWRFYTDLLRLRVVRTFTLFLLWVTFSCKKWEEWLVSQGKCRKLVTGDCSHTVNLWHMHPKCTTVMKRCKIKFKM